VLGPQRVSGAIDSHESAPLPKESRLQNGPGRFSIGEAEGQFRQQIRQFDAKAVSQFQSEVY
jgi:hypothetical protein